MIISPTVIAGEAGYTTSRQLRQAWDVGAFSQTWSMGGLIVSGKLNTDHGKGLWKSYERFTPPISEDMLNALALVGVKHPSSYADCYHQIAPATMRVKRTINAIFDFWSGGPWQEARTCGTHSGTWYRYDICSAYRWAAMLGLPDMSSVTVWSDRKFDPDVPGLWVVSLDKYDRTRRNLPRLLLGDGPVVLSTEEMRLYDLRPERVHRAVTWSRWMPFNFVEDTLVRLPCAKEAGRAYWGRWIARDKLTCRSVNNKWSLCNNVANFVWGWLIVGRVRSRVWQASQYACHVYVDEVLVPHELPTGEGIGDWRLKERYNGIQVKRTGWYGTPSGASIMQTGVPLNHRAILQ